ncbi:MAG: Na+/H+ antiporter subunit E [Gammaproteobacteria bacterium]|nr:Na+/H+ antiporter subunit E [Gammaproteobacteria bacterium]MCP5137748.1 Na+/H+ antiporter subunit E [Gammaproteobacteria bacterium]
MSRTPVATVTFGIRLFVAGLLFLLWAALLGRFDAQEWVIGALLVLMVTALAEPHLGIFSGVRLTSSAPVHFLRWLGFFLMALVRANLDMARRVLSPTLPLNPGFVEVRTALTSPLGKLALANSITLTPGTLAVDIDDDRLLVHWVDVNGSEDIDAATAEIAAGFERHLRGFLK